MYSLFALKLNFPNIRILSKVIKGNNGPLFQFCAQRTPTFNLTLNQRSITKRDIFVQGSRDGKRKSRK